MGLSVAAGALLAVVACEAVPDLTFETGDATTGATCPEAAPPGASVCCGDIACSGNCTAECSACIARCDAGSLCCAKTNNVLCRPPGSACN
jgi:hypothetical protein